MPIQAILLFIPSVYCQQQSLLVARNLNPEPVSRTSILTIMLQDNKCDVAIEKRQPGLQSTSFILNAE